MKRSELTEEVSVTKRIKQTKQPYGGYLPPKSFEVKSNYVNNGGVILDMTLEQTQDERKLHELLQSNANLIPNSASDVQRNAAKTEEVIARIAQERSQKEAEQARHREALEAHGESQIALLQKQLEEERQANVELRQANAILKTTVENSTKEAKFAKIFAWISAGIGTAGLMTAIIAVLV